MAYTPEEVLAALDKAEAEGNYEVPNVGPYENLLTICTRLGLSTELTQLLQSKREQYADPSKVQMKIWHEFAAAKVPLIDALDLFERSGWNKYQGRKDELRRVITEARRAYAPIRDSRIENETQWDTAATLLAQDFELRWLVRDIWLESSHGVIAGIAKSLKSTTVLDLAVSVASGRKFLDTYEVNKQGPVLLVLNEDSRAVISERLMKLGRYKMCRPQGEFSREEVKQKCSKLPLHMLIAKGFTLRSSEWMERLSAKIEEVKPVLVILDPFYLMFEGEINSMSDVMPALRSLLELRHKYGCAVAVCHHKGKTDKGSDGQDMIGSTAFHGWAETGLYLATFKGPKPGTVKLRIARQIRQAGILPKIWATVHPGKVVPPFIVTYEYDHQGFPIEGTEEVMDNPDEELGWYWVESVEEGEEQKRGGQSDSQNKEGGRLERQERVRERKEQRNFNE